MLRRGDHVRLLFREGLYLYAKVCMGVCTYVCVYVFLWMPTFVDCDACMKLFMEIVLRLFAF